jgi:hypothetical protein
MTSNVNVNFPVDNVDVSKALMRDQFATIKTEIDALQSASFADYTENGIMVYNNTTGTTVGRSIQGTAGQINVTNNNGVDGNINISFVTSPTLVNATLTTPSITGGTLANSTITGGTLNNTVIGSVTPAAATFTTINGVTPATAQYTTAEETKLAGIETGADVTDSTNVLAALVGQALVVGTLNGVTPATAQYTTAEETKLAGIETGADVTDTTNVTAAGALMDSELTNIAAVKALNQGVATTDSPSFVAINGVTPATAQYTTAEETKLAGIETGADVTDSTNVLASLTGQAVIATSFAGALDGVLGGNTPAAATVTTFTSNGIDDNATSTKITLTDADVNFGGNSLSNFTLNLTAGVTSDVYAIGNSGTGTITVSLVEELLQTLTITGSFTLAPPSSGNGVVAIIATTNSTGGYAITTSGFTKVNGTYDNTANKVHRFVVTKISTTTILDITEVS